MCNKVQGMFIKDSNDVYNISRVHYTVLGTGEKDHSRAKQKCRNHYPLSTGYAPKSFKLAVKRIFYLFIFLNL